MSVANETEQAQVERTVAALKGHVARSVEEGIAGLENRFQRSIDLLDQAIADVKHRLAALEQRK